MNNCTFLVFTLSKNVTSKISVQLIETLGIFKLTGDLFHVKQSHALFALITVSLLN